METTLTLETLTIPSADLGEENPFPDLKAAADLHSQTAFDNSVSPEESQYYNYGKVSGILPYRFQDGYNRKKKPKSHDCVVLENRYLRAEFLPHLGGRLWSLYDKEKKRNLIHRNPVFQPANLALRDAWFSGGVEWNVGMTGHTPYTASPLFAAKYTRSDGVPVLRLYEWERIRRVLYQLDFFLPPDSRFLFVHVHLRNTREETVPIYWWSNIAVDETPGTRVLAPAEKAFFFNYGRAVYKAPMPDYEGKDASYPATIDHSMDLFFDLPQGQRKWEAAINEAGDGLIHASTDLLQGRKLFLWGSGSGGRQWQTFLSQPGEAYIEIQAGLANTQMEHLPMPAGASWDWLEAYGPIHGEPEKIHNIPWNDAWPYVDGLLNRMLPKAELDRLLAEAKVEGKATGEPLFSGSGWAALELLRQGKENAFPRESAQFPLDSLGTDQQPWAELLKTGVFPAGDPAKAPAPYLVQDEWMALLEKSVLSGKGANWQSWLQLGVAYYAGSGEKPELLEKAIDAFRRSNAASPNGWALRNLARLLIFSGDKAQAVELMREAAALLPYPKLAVECGRLLLDEKDATGFVRFYDSLGEGLRQNGRLLAFRAEAAIALKDWALAEEILSRDITITDLREGETLLSELWISLHMAMLREKSEDMDEEALRAAALEQYPVPAHLDFRMKV